MSRYSKDHQVNVRLPGPYKAALDRIIADVQGLTSLKFNGEKVSFEALISSWILHFAERGHGEVVAVLERHLPAIGRDYESIRVSRIKEPPPASVSAGPTLDLGVPAPKKAGRRKRQG